MFRSGRAFKATQRIRFRESAFCLPLDETRCDLRRKLRVIDITFAAV